jgi:tagaturonate reductase
MFTIDDCIVGKYVHEAIFSEILPVLNFPDEVKIVFAKNIIERFQNPFIKHYLLSISLNSVSKYEVRVLPTLLEYVKANNRLPKVLIFSLAALILFYKNQYSINDRIELREYQINDDPDVIGFFKELSNEINCRTIITKTLSNAYFWGTDLNKIDEMTEKVTEYYKSISMTGMRDAIIELLK